MIFFKTAITLAPDGLLSNSYPKGGKMDITCG